MILKVRNGADIDVPLQYREPATVTAHLTTTAGLDLVAVERALSGEEPRPHLLNAEAHLAWQLITSPQEEAPDRPVAALLGVTDRTVCRWRNGHTRTATVADIDQAPGGGEMRDRWESQAACVGRDLEEFFPAGDSGKAATGLYQQAVQVCQACPVRLQCLRFVMRAEGASARATRSGVFGGLTPAERYELYRHRSKASAA